MGKAPPEVADPSPGSGFWGHVQALRQALLWSVAGWIVAAAVAWNWWPLVWQVFSIPLNSMPHPPRIVATSPTATVTMSFQLALVAGSLLAAPWILWQLWRFASPALRIGERRIALKALAWTMLLFLAGAVTGYFTILPMTLRWLADYGEGRFEALWNVEEFTTMTVKMLLGFGAMFEFPLLTWVLGSLGVVTHRQLLSWSRGAVVLIFVLAAVLTPPDPVSQCLMAAPMLLLYYGGVLTALWASPSRTGDS